MPKISARRLTLKFKNRNNIEKGKDYECGKFLWRDTRKEIFIFWLSNWSYLIMSSSSSTLLLDILIFHCDVWQSLFLYNNLLHSAILWADNAMNNLFHLGVEFFSTLKRQKNFQFKERKLLFLVGAFAQS